MEVRIQTSFKDLRRDVVELGFELFKQRFDLSDTRHPDETPNQHPHINERAHTSPKGYIE